MRTLGTSALLRAAVVLAVCAAGCGSDKKASSDSDATLNDGGTGGQTVDSGVTGGVTGGVEADAATGGDSDAAPTPDAGPAGIPLGAECESPPACRGNADDPAGCCNGDDTDSDACKTGGCSSGVCQTRFSELKGYCTRACERDSACENFADGPFGSQFMCLNDNTDGQCNPGSNHRCDGPANGSCDDPNEVCTFGRTFQADSFYGGLCQPARQGGAGVGEPCDEEAGSYCANGMCLAGKCSTFCDPTADTSPCKGGLVCFNDFSFSNGQLLLDICAPAYCEKNADCGADEVCGITLDFGGNPLIEGICVPKDVSQPGVGDACAPGATSCDGGNLCVGDNSEYCSGFCDTDADCPNGACTVTSLLLDSTTMQTAPIQLCVPAAPGSGRACASNTDCAPAGDVAQESCEPIVRGDIRAGLSQGPLTVEGRCVAIPAHAVAAGEACSANAPCQTASLCNSGFCSSMCRTTEDCGAAGFCQNALVDDGGTNALSDNVYTGLCAADAGSHIPCTHDVDCGDTEFCRANVLLTNGTSSVEQFCSANAGAGVPGAECHSNGDCKSDRCAAWSKRAADPGYCTGTCVDDADCSADGTATCEDSVIYTGDDGAADDVHGKICVPVHTCASCDFGVAHPCGGTTVCGEVSFAGGRMGGACLEPCGDGGACADGYACQPVLGADGNQVGGQTACVPTVPDNTCLSARPLR